MLLYHQAYKFCAYIVGYNCVLRDVKGTKIVIKFQVEWIFSLNWQDTNCYHFKHDLQIHEKFKEFWIIVSTIAPYIRMLSVNCGMVLLICILLHYT